MQYASSTLDKNRKVYDKFLKNKDLKALLNKVNNILKEKIKIYGKLEITKLVGGISAHKIINWLSHNKCIYKNTSLLSYND